MRRSGCNVHQNFVNKGFAEIRLKVGIVCRVLGAVFYSGDALEDNVVHGIDNRMYMVGVSITVDDIVLAMLGGKCYICQ